MSINVVKCQTKVITVIGNIRAIVTGICIRDESISYEISYFHDGVAHNCWVKRYEFEIDMQEKKRAGLVNYDKNEEEGTHSQILLIS